MIAREQLVSMRLSVVSRRVGCAAAGSAAALALAASATSARSAASACQASSLSASFGGQGATQAIVGALTITNNGETACRVTGHPAIAMRTAGSTETLHELAWSSSAFPGTHFSSSVLLRPRDSASVRIRWMNWCDPKVSRSSPPGNTARGKRPSQILVTVAPGTRPISASVTGGLRQLGLPDCIVPGRPSTIEVTLWTTR
jgi:Protein of unknown function (DUF4232)